MSSTIIEKIKKNINLLVSQIKRKKKRSFVDAEHDIKLLRNAHGRKFPSLKQLIKFKKVLNKREKFFLNLAFVFFAIAIVWFGIDFVAKNRTKVPAVGGTYIEAVVGSPELINPVFASMNDVDFDISRLVFSGLLRYDEKQRLVPDLAVKYNVSEDGRVYTFELKKDVVWHDGEPFSARDVVFTIETIQDPSVNSPLLVSFQGVKAEAIDDYTVQFTLQESFPPFVSSLTLGILPEHIWASIPAERMKLAQQNWQPIGTGPFIFTNLAKDESGYIYSYSLSRYDKYYRQSPFIEEFIFQFYPEYAGPAGAIEALRSQKVDGISFVPSDLKEKVARKHINLHTLQLPQYTALFFNAEKQSLLEDLDFKTSLAKAIDKDRILRDVLKGDGQIIYSPILPGFPGFNPEIEKVNYSTEEANAILDEMWERITYSDYRQERKEFMLSKWETVYDEEHQESSTSTEDNTENSDEAKEMARREMEAEIDKQLDEELNEAQIFFRKDDDGNLIQLNLVTADTQEYRQVAQLIAGFWQEIGIKTNLKFVPSRSISREVLRERDYDVLLYGEIIGSDPDQYPFWHSSQIEFPGLNLSLYENERVDEILEEARETSDQDKIVELYQEFEDIILEEKPAVFLYMPTYTYATTDEIKGFDVTRISNPADRFADVTTWYIETDGRWDFK
ncbi:MAG: hypothetical protein GF349_01210 [Candidatus Magasanikbacteria bacterium]|nr:hypothetical protein [Candidatus Magasanikbacteria bacterium]